MMVVQEITVLGIETSCDETAAAIVRGARRCDGYAAGAIIGQRTYAQFE